MVKLPDVPQLDIREFNESELVALCRWMGILASRAWPRSLLEQALQKFESYEIEEPFSIMRKRLSDWYHLYWDRLQMQANKGVCPDCEWCRPLQVLECYKANQRNIEGK